MMVNVGDGTMGSGRGGEEMEMCFFSYARGRFDETHDTAYLEAAGCEHLRLRLKRRGYIPGFISGLCHLLHNDTNTDKPHLDASSKDEDDESCARTARVAKLGRGLRILYQSFSCISVKQDNGQELRSSGRQP